MNAHTAPPYSDPVTPGTRRRLMVVDDALESRQVLTDYFVARGYEVSVATDGVQALAKTLTSAVDVVIMKATLPGLEGYEAAAILRKIAPRVQIILTMAAGVETRPPERRRTERFRCFPTPLNLPEIAGAVEGAWAGTAPDPERDPEDLG